jgi:hypothetical protein
MYTLLVQNNWHMITKTLPELNQRIKATAASGTLSVQRNSSIHLPVLDTFHLTRSFKLYNDSVDGIHFYSEQREYIGNLASQFALKMILA